MSTLASILLAGCYFAPGTSADDSVDPGQQPPGNLFGADAGAGSGSGSGGCVDTALKSLRIRVRTTTLNGRYSPRNIGAIWIETAQGAFVKTIERWGSTRARWLTRFNAASGGNLVDAITSATLSQHVTHDRSWDLTNLMKCEIPAGAYQVLVEMTDHNGSGPSVVMPFTKADAPLMLTPAETTNFHDLLLDLE